MPTSGNLKSGDFLFCIIPPPQYQRSTPLLPPPPRPISIIIIINLYLYTKSQGQFDPDPNRLRTLYEVLHELQIITIHFYGCNGEIIFVSDAIRAKMPQKPSFESKTIRILGEKGVNSKVKHRKAQYAILSGRFVGPYGRPGDCCRIRESWHV